MNSSMGQSNCAGETVLIQQTLVLHIYCFLGCIGPQQRSATEDVCSGQWLKTNTKSTMNEWVRPEWRGTGWGGDKLRKADFKSPFRPDKRWSSTWRVHIPGCLLCIVLRRTWVYADGPQDDANGGLKQTRSKGWSPRLIMQPTNIIRGTIADIMDSNKWSD